MINNTSQRQIIKTIDSYELSVESLLKQLDEERTTLVVFHPTDLDLPLKAGRVNGGRPFLIPHRRHSSDHFVLSSLVNYVLFDLAKRGHFESFLFFFVLFLVGISQR
jgi:hypothetical protein